MVPSDLKRRAGAVLLAWLAFSSTALAATPPRLVVVPFGQGDGAPEGAGARFAGLVADELKSRDEEVTLVAAAAAKAAPAPVAKAAMPSVDPLALLAEGKRALADLKFDEAATSLRRGLDLSLADPANADFAQVLDGYVSLAVAAFRQGEEKAAQAALVAVARFDPAYKLAEGKYPPVFLRELDKAKKRVAKAGKGAISVEGPPGSTVFVDGHDLGMAPALAENLAAGQHYVKVVASSGNLFGQAVEVKGGVHKVKAVFVGAVAMAATAGPSAPRVGPVLDGDAAGRIAQYARAVGADYALVGVVYRSGEHQVTAATALYSVKRQGFAALPAFSLDHELLTAYVEAFKLAEASAKKAAAFGSPVALPLILVAEKPPAVAAGAPRPADVEVAAPNATRVALKPAPEATANGASAGTDGNGRVRALARPSTFEGDGPAVPDAPGDKRPEVSRGTPVWVWVLIGAGVAAAAGGAYYGINEAARPVTGTVTDTW